MTQYYGDFVEDAVVYLIFNTFTSDDPSASCTITNFVNTDVHIHKDGGVVQRNNAAGVTVSVDFDGITGSHMIAIDTSDNTVAGFWVTGSDYFVRIEGTTVDGATINAVVGHFSIENRYMRGTENAATASALTTHDGKLDTVDSNVDAVLVDTGTDIPARFTGIEGATFLTGTDSLEAIRDRGDAAWTTGAGGSAPTVEEIRIEMDTNSADLNAILADTNELQINQSNWATATGFSVPNEYDAVIAALQTDLDNPDQYKANIAALALEATLTDMKGVTFLTGTDSLEAIRNRGDDAWVTGAGGSSPTVEEIRIEMDTNSIDLNAILADTNELQTNQGDWATATGFSVPNEYDAVLAALQADLDNPDQYKADVAALALEATLTDIKGATFLTGTDSLEAIRDRGDAAWTTGAGGTAPTVEEIRQEMDANSVDLNAILADTNELQGNQGNWATATGFNTVVPDAAGTAPTAAEIRTEMEAAGSSLAQILADTGTDGVVVADKTGYALSGVGVDAILDEVVEGTLTHRQIIRILLAALAGKSTGGGTATLTFRDDADAKARITATVDANGNRTAITKDGA